MTNLELLQKYLHEKWYENDRKLFHTSAYGNIYKKPILPDEKTQISIPYGNLKAYHQKEYKNGIVFKVPYLCYWHSMHMDALYPFCTELIIGFNYFEDGFRGYIYIPENDEKPTKLSMPLYRSYIDKNEEPNADISQYHVMISRPDNFENGKVYRNEKDFIDAIVKIGNIKMEINYISPKYGEFTYRDLIQINVPLLSEILLMPNDKKIQYISNIEILQKLSIQVRRNFNKIL